MQYLMLRGQVPQDRSPKEIMFESLQKEDDMWTHLLHSLVQDGDDGEVWYWGGKRYVEYADNFRIRWTTDYKKIPLDPHPDVVFARGGFRENHRYLKRLEKSVVKIYYGAGVRFLPQEGFTDYDLILVDSEDQKAIAEKKFPGITCRCFFKPAPENMFYRKINQKKEYDVCFVAVHPGDKRKRVKWVHRTVPPDLKVLQLGSKSKTKPSNVSNSRVLRGNMYKSMNRCRVGILPYTEDDSGPRVLSEFLATGTPVVCMNTVRFWHEKFDPIVRIAGKQNFWGAVRKLADATRHMAEIRWETEEYYKENLSLAQAGKHLRRVIAEAIEEKEMKGERQHEENHSVFGSVRQAPFFAR